MDNTLSLDILSDIIEKGNKKVEKKKNKILKEANEVVIKFIKKNKLVVYGGTAINELLKLKGDNIYASDDVLDYDFYSPDPYKHSFELSNELMKEGFKYIVRMRAVHESTFKINIDFNKQNIADITYIPLNVIKNLPYKTIDGLRYINEDIIILNFIRSFIRIENLFRWSKDYKRFIKFVNVYPFKQSKITIKKIKKSKHRDNFAKMLSKLDKDLYHFTGFHTYNTLMEVTKNEELLLPKYFYTLFSASYDLHKNKFEKKYKIKEYHKLTDYLPKHFKVFTKTGMLLAEVYDFNVFDAYKIINSEKHVIFSLNILYLYSKYLTSRMEKDDYFEKLYKNMIYNLYSEQRRYNNANGLLGIENDNPFQIFMDRSFNDANNDLYVSNTKRFYTGAKDLLFYKPEIKKLDEMTKIFNYSKLDASEIRI